MGTWLLERLTFGTKAIESEHWLWTCVWDRICTPFQILASGFWTWLSKKPPTDSFLMLAGKQGRPFLSESTGGGIHLGALLKSERVGWMQWLLDQHVVWDGLT